MFLILMKCNLFILLVPVLLVSYPTNCQALEDEVFPLCSESPIVLVLTFRSLSHLELILVDDAR
jgi:hypothetical protein